LQERVAGPIDGIRKYGPFVLRGRANSGYCLTCDHRTLFVETGPWLANEYLCVRCHSMPRWRALIRVLNTRFTDWRSVRIHEAGASGLATEKIRREATNYSGSRYLVPDVPRGELVGNVSCQDLEGLTFPDESFDLFITQDVMEHVLRPDRAFAEIARVLRPGGAHVFTVPMRRGAPTLVRAVPSGEGIEYLLPAEYHGGPGNPERSLVVHEWGDGDFAGYVSDHGGLTTEIIELHNRKLGLDGSPGHPQQVFVSRKGRPSPA
jgi:SAM-dependent methyltransferase